MFDFSRSILQPPTFPSLQLGTYHTSPPSVLHPAHLCLPTADPSLCSFIFALQLLPKIHLCPPRRKTLHPPYALTPCPSAFFSSFPALVLPTEEPQSTSAFYNGMRTAQEHKSLLLSQQPASSSSSSSWLLHPLSLQLLDPVQLQLLSSFHWHLLWFLNILRHFLS